MRTNFDNYLDLPKRSVDPSSTQVIDALNNLGRSLQTEQEEVNYSTASMADKQAESILKLQQTRTIENFSDLSKNISVVQGQQDVTVVDSSTKIPVLTGSKDPYGIISPVDYTLNANENKTNELKVKLTSQPFNETVVFEVMPTISESRNVTYEEFSPLHHPGEIIKYKSTASRSWQVSTKLISRNSDEATKNLKIINIIRAWAMPFYGLGTERDKSTNQFLGGPPPILTLSAYGKMMIGPVSCVLESYNWEFPNTIDYLPAFPDGPNNTPTPFPVILGISLNLKESLSPAEFSGFDLVKYKNGEMPGAFTAISAQNQSAPNTYPSQVVPASIANEPANVTESIRSTYGIRDF